MANKPSLAKGTRDFSPVELAKRNYIFDTIKKHFQGFGFQPIETPSFENSETLMGKYGDEGDRLIFKILDSGDYFLKNQVNIGEAINIAVDSTKYFEGFFLSIKENLNSSSSYEDIVKYINENLRVISIGIGAGTLDFSHKKHLEEYILNQKHSIAISIVNNFNFFDNQDAFAHFIELESAKITEKAVKYLIDKLVTKEISEKALRYDLTVPFARYVVMNQNNIDFPFKRYQIQPVWRADRPQKGRFREFFQCDADVIGSASLWQEVEFVQLYDAVFTDLGVNGVTVKMNNRKILSGIAEVIGAQDKLIDFTVALDKLDKIGEDGVKKEMLEKGITEEAIAKVQPLFSFTGSNIDKLNQLQDMLATSETGLKGVEELLFIVSAIEELGLQTATLTIDVTLARGLNYYTGAIFEVAAPKEVQLGSIGGGGRYDDLTGIFGLKDMSGVGISFGLDRIVIVLDELKLFPETVNQTIDALFINFGEKEAMASFKLVQQLRKAGYKADMYPDAAKPAKQFKYADKRNVPHVITIGSQELAANTFVCKNMVTGEQKTYGFNELSAVFPAKS